MLEFRGVSKVYERAVGGRVEALVDLSFEVKPTELAVLVGPGGAGKSTLLRLVTGEERGLGAAGVVDGVEVGAPGGAASLRLRGAGDSVPGRASPTGTGRRWAT